MAEHITECTICLVQFQTHDELREHSSMFQSEIARLLADLQSLLVHRWPQHRPSECTSKIGDTEDGERSNYMGASPYSCPHEDCSGSASTFQREQDLIRHYGIHCKCNEFCQYCDNVFTRANKFWQHKCVTKEPTRCNEDVMARKKALRNMSKEKLLVAMKAKKRRFAAETTESGHAKRLKITTSGVQGVLSVDTNVQLPQDASFTLPTHRDVVTSTGSVETLAGAYQQSNDAPIWPNGIYSSNQHAEDGAMFTQLWPQLEISAHEPALILDPTSTIMSGLCRSSIANQPGCELSTSRSSHLLDQNPFLSTDERRRLSDVPVFPVHTCS